MFGGILYTCCRVRTTSATLLLVLVLLSTHVSAPNEREVKKVSYSCFSEPKTLPCRKLPCKMLPCWDSGNPILTVAALCIIATGPHSLISRVSSNTKFSYSFLDWVAVTTSVVGGIYLLILLGMTSWFIIISTWIGCTAIVSRINPITVKRTVSAKQLWSVDSIWQVGRYIVDHAMAKLMIANMY